MKKNIKISGMIRMSNNVAFILILLLLFPLMVMTETVDNAPGGEESLSYPDKIDVSENDIAEIERIISQYETSRTKKIDELTNEIYEFDDAVILRKVELGQRSISELKSELADKRKENSDIRKQLKQEQGEFDRWAGIEQSLMMSIDTDTLNGFLFDYERKNWQLARKIMKQTDGILPASVVSSEMWNALSEDELEEAIAFIKSQRARLQKVETELNVMDRIDFRLRKKEFYELFLSSLTPEAKKEYLSMSLETAKKRLMDGLAADNALSEVNIQVAYRRLEELDSIMPTDSPEKSETKILLAMAATETGRLDRAGTVLSTLVDVITPDNPLYGGVLIQEMQIAFAEKHYGKVIGLAEKLLKVHNLASIDLDRARYLAGLSEFLSGNPVAGREFLENIKGGNAYYYYSRFYLALDYAKNGDYAAASEGLMHLLEIIPTHRKYGVVLERRTTLVLGYILFDMDKPLQALRLFQSIPVKSSFGPSAVYGTAWCLIKLEELDEASAQLSFCRRLASGTRLEYEAAFTQIDLMKSRKKYDEALDYCRELSLGLESVNTESDAVMLTEELQEVKRLKTMVGELTGLNDKRLEEINRRLNDIDSELVDLLAKMGGEIKPEELRIRLDREIAEIKLARLNDIKDGLAKLNSAGATTTMTGNDH